jgi:hypothetical protein
VPLVLLLSCTILGPWADEDRPGNGPGGDAGRDSEVDTESDRDSGPDGDSGQKPVECEVRKLIPLDLPGYHRGLVSAELSSEDEGAEITVEGVEGAHWVSGRWVYFQPEGPLAPSTAYSATLSACGFQFGTRTYLVENHEGRTLIPDSVGSILENYLDMLVLVTVTADEGAAEVDVAIADTDGQQDACNRTATLSGRWEDGYLHIEGEDLVVGDHIVDQLLVSGSVSPDLSELVGLRVRMLLANWSSPRCRSPRPVLSPVRRVETLAARARSAPAGPRRR